MLSSLPLSSIIENFLGPNGRFSELLEGYEHRESQIAMAEAVHDVLVRGGKLVVEAGTGTGKTMAYLLPALLKGDRVIVSTGTRNLQDQIFEKDLPLLERALGRPIRATVMKGLTNYLCLRRTDELLKSARAEEPAIKKKLPLIERFMGETQTGDRAELRELPEDDPVWGHVASSTETRIGPRCSFHEDCYITRMRRRAEESELIIVNHHLFFADLAMRLGRAGTGIIPDYETVIFDEAHQIEDTATLFFGVQVTRTRAERLHRDAARAAEAKGGALLVQSSLRTILDDLKTKTTEFFAALPRPSEGRRLNFDPSMLKGHLKDAYLAFDTALEALESHASLHAIESEALTQIARRASSLRDDLAQILDAVDGPSVAWVARDRDSVSLGASPLEIGPILESHLFESLHAAVLTSATLSVDDDLEFISGRLGVRDGIELILPSPFDYRNQAGLYIARELPEPRHPDYLDDAAHEVKRLIEITRGGAFVLTTSYRVMNFLRQELAESLPYPLLIQGEAPKAELLERFRESGDAVLFATSSFWEGVDVPGAALRLVILDKLPFGAPDDPLLQARGRRLEERGESAFRKLSLPDAALNLKQGFGRLIRTRKDRGIVAILDPRLVKKGYGRVLLRSLPPASRLNSFAEVEAFWGAGA